MHLSLATSADLPEGYLDTPGLIDALHKEGIEGSLRIWDDPSVDWSKFDAVLLHTTWDYTEKHARFLEWCRRVSKQGRLLNDYDIVRSNSTKHYLLKLQENGVATPPTVLIPASSRTSADFLAKHFEGQVVVKPAVDAGGHKARRFKSVQEALPYLQELAGEDLLLQEFVSEILERGEQSAVMIDGHLSHVVRKQAREGEFRVQDTYGGMISSGNASAELEAYCLDVLQKLGDDPLYARIDFVQAGTRLLMEVEMTEPELFLRFYPQSYVRFAEALVKYLRSVA